MRLFLKKPTLFNNSIRSVFINQNQKPKTISIYSSSMATTNEEGTAKRFWDKFSKQSIQTLYTPFLVSLASGNLKLDTFSHYISQDVHFYKSFAHA